MTKITVTKIHCDRCGTDVEETQPRGEKHSLRMTLHSTTASMAYDGAWGGASNTREIDLCYKCIIDFQKWFDKKQKET